MDHLSPDTNDNTMYTYREKKRHFLDLQNVAAADADLELLRSIAPNHASLKTFTRNPQKKAVDILHALLDVATRESILLNRRSAEKAKEETPADDEGKGDETGNEEAPAATEEEESKTSELEEKVSELEEKVEEAEERADEAEERVEELEEKVSELEEKVEETEAALEEEKKKIEEQPNQPEEASPKKSSTRKSSGTSSKTKTSKQPQSSTTTE